MQWSDNAIILSVRKHGETSALVRLLSRTHGVYGGVVRGAQSKAHRGVLQPGNRVNASWSARLSEQLGSFKIELLEANMALLMQDAGRLSALSSACAIMEAALPERHPYPKLYQCLQGFLHSLKETETWYEAYVMLEMDLLAESGFGLDLTACAATGATENLRYVSPKSGRAVSAEAGEPYKHKLLPLPSFLLPPPPAGGRAGEGAYRESLPQKTPTQPSPLLGEGEAPSYRKFDRHGSHALIDNARQLRKAMPEAERQLWYHLRAQRFEGYRFRRQHPLSPHYIADFICLSKKLVIELDGGQHSEQQSYDAKRTAFLESEGYRVLRFWNNEVLGNMDGVLQTILHALQAPSPTLPPAGGGRNTKEILDGLQLTGYFLELGLFTPHNRRLPAARRRLLDMMKEPHGAEA